MRGNGDDVFELAGPDETIGTADDLVTLPARDLDLILQDRAEWRACAEARKRAGRWRSR